MIVIYECFLSFKGRCLVIIPCINTRNWSSHQRALVLIYPLVLQPLNPLTTLRHVTPHVTCKCSFPVLAHQETQSNLSESQKKEERKSQQSFRGFSVCDRVFKSVKVFCSPWGRKPLAFLLHRCSAANSGSEFDFQMCWSRGGLLSHVPKGSSVCTCKECGRERWEVFPSQVLTCPSMPGQLTDLCL